jgi:hypothetical protein
MRVISIDLAYRKPLAVCVLSAQGKPLILAEIPPQGDLYKTATSLVDFIVPIGKDSLVIAETPLYLQNLKTAFMMIRIHAMIEKGIRDAGLLFFGIHPLTWQKAILHPTKGADRKALSRGEAELWLTQLEEANRFPLGEGNDLADAVNIARYGHINKKNILQAFLTGEKFSEKEKK